MHRPHIRKDVEQDRVARLVVGRDALILFRDHPAVLLRADPHFNKRLVDIVLHQELSPRLGRIDRGLIHEVLQIRSGKAGCRLGDPVQIHILSQGLLLRVHAQNLLAALYVRLPHRHLAVKTARAQNRGIEDIDAVRRGHDNDALIGAEAVHFHQKLV